MAPDGTYGAANDTVFSDSSPDYVYLEDNLPVDRTSIRGLIHNHAGSPSGDYFTNIMYSYPSQDDWKVLAHLVKTYNLDPGSTSLWIVDAWGNMREFKFNDMDKYFGMTNDAKKDPANLPPKSEVKGCSST